MGPPREVICRKYCCNKEGMNKLGDKRKEGRIVNRRIDIRVQCPSEMHIRLCLLSDRRFLVITKFVDSHSHDLSSLDKVHHFYSHQTHRSKMSRNIMTNLFDVEMRPSNIGRVVNAMNHGEGCKHVSSQQVIDFICHKRNNIGQDLFLSSNIFKRKQSQIQNFSLLVRLVVQAHEEVSFVLMEE